MGKLVIILSVFATIFAAAVAGPIEFRGGSCARQCTESKKFQYQNGKSYSYDYEMETVSTLEGTTNEASRLHMRCKVELNVVSNCEMIMRLSDVTLEQSSLENSRSRKRVDQEGEFKRSLEQHPMRFAFQDGRVDNICPSEAESVDALNIKRGILSAFQTSVDSLEESEKVIESDISGTCTTVYEAMPKGWKVKSLRKTKDFASCSERSSNFIDESESSKSQPIVKGTQECTQNFRDSRLDSVTCTETHLLRPFSRQQKSGAVTRVKQTLTYVSETRSTFSGNEFVPSTRSLIFDHSEIDEAQRSRLTRHAEETFVKLCEASKNDIRITVPRLFTTFVHNLKNLQHSDLVNLNQRIGRICPDNTRAQKMFIDAIAMCGSTGAARMMADLSEQGKVTSVDIDLWLNSLTFVKNPDRQMLAAVVSLMQRKESFLGVSSLVHTYCTKNVNCHEEQEVRQIVRKVIAALGNDCTGENKEEMLLALKALGNMGVTVDAQNILRKCFETLETETEIRVAAIQAFRRSGCSDTPLSTLTTLLRNANEKVEVRIAAFIAAMKCPTMETLSEVRDMLKEEKINQVGSFVWSYIQLMAKNKKDDWNLSDILDDKTLVNKFQKNAMKYSRAYGSSFFLESMDIGAEAQGHVVFTPEGYLPRSLMLNLTVDILGSSVNILELEGRAEGMERLVESLFGPEGYFRQQSEESNKRERKSSEEKALQAMGDKYEVKSRFEREPIASIDMKMFGNSMLYKRFGLSMNQGRAVGGSIEAMSLPEILAELAKERDITFTKSMILFDTSFTLPTGAGFPLKLALEGTASVDLKINGKMDMRSIDNVDVRGVVQPSGAIEMSAVMSVEATKDISAGLKLVATLHSSTLMDGLVEIRSGRVIRTQINVPRDQIELFDLQTRVFLVRNNDEREPSTPADMNSYKQCFASNVIGMEFCGEMQIPSVRKGMPLYPLNGATVLKAFMRKTDPTLNQYSFELNWNPEQEGRSEAVIRMSTPGSSIDREVSTGFTLNKESQTFTFWGRVPNHKVSVNGKIVSNEVENRVTFGVSLNEVEKFSVDGSLGIDGVGKNGIRYTPSLTVLGPNSRKLLTFRSQASVRPGRKYSGEMSLEDLTEKPIVLKGDFTLGDRKEVSLSLTSSAAEIAASGFVTIRSNTYSMKGNVEYTITGSRKEKFEIAGKFRDLSANSLAKYSGQASLTNSAYPEYSTTFQWDTQLTNGHVENTIELNIGDGRGNVAHKITLQEIVTWEGSLSENTAVGTLRLSYPMRDMDYLIKAEHQNTPTSASDKITIRIDKNREYLVNFGGSMNGRPLRANTHFQITSGNYGNIVKLEGMAKQSGDSRNDYDASLLAEFYGKNQFLAKASFGDSSDSSKNEYKVNTEVTLPNSRRPIVTSADVMFSRGHYVVSGDLNTGKSIYGSKVEYTTVSKLNHRISGAIRTPMQTYTAEASLEGSRDQLSIKTSLQGPQRISGSVDLKNTEQVKTGFLSVLWDADRDVNKRFTVDSELKMLGNDNQGRLVVSYPGRTLSGSFAGNVEGQLSKRMKVNGNAEFEWKTGSKIRFEVNGNAGRGRESPYLRGEAKMMTPFNGIENVAVSVQHTGAAGEWKNEVGAEWQHNKKVTVVTECKHQLGSFDKVFDITTQINTPFRNYESMMGQAAFKINSNELSSTLTTRWARKVFQVVANATPSPLSAMINVTTPFASLRQASTSFSFSKPSDNSFKTEADLTWNEEQVAVKALGSSDFGNNKRSCKFEMVATSTLENYEKFVADWSYAKLRREVNMAVSMGLNENNFKLGMVGKNRSQRSGTELEGEVVYTSNNRNFRDVVVKGKLTNVGNQYSSLLNAKLPYGADLNMEYSMNPKEVVFTLSSDKMYGLRERMSAYLNANLESQRLTGNGQITYGRTVSKVDLFASSVFNSRGHEIVARLSMNAPALIGNDDATFNFEHKRRENLYTTSIIASAKRQEVRANNEIKIIDATNFETTFSLNTPFRNYRTIQGSLSQQTSQVQMKHRSELNVAGNKIASLSGEISQNYQSPRIFTAKMNAIFPFETLNKLNFESNLEMIPEAMSLEPKMTLQWNENGRLSFNGIFHPMANEPTIEARISSSVPKMEDLAFSASYNINNKQKTAKTSLRWAADKEVTVNGAYSLDRAAMNLELAATTPFEGLETMSIQNVFTFNQREKSGQVIVEYSRTRVQVNGKYKVSSRGREFSIQYTTPFSGWNNGALRGSYSGIMNDFTVDLSSEWYPSNKMGLNFIHKLNSGKMSTRLAINTPFRGYKKMETNVEADVQSPRMTVSLTNQWENNQPLRSNVVLESDLPRAAMIAFDLTSPFRGFESLKLNGDYRMTDDSYNMESSFQWEENKKVTLNVEGKIHQKELTIFLDTPFRPVSNVRFNLVGSSEQIRATFQWEQQSNRIELVLSGKIGNRNAEGSLTLTTPFRNFHQLSGSIEMSVSDNRWSTINGAVKLDTPFESVRGFQADCRLQTTPNNYEAEINIVPSRNAEKIQLSGYARKNADQMEGQLKCEPYSVTATLKGNRLSMIDAELNVNKGMDSLFNTIVSMRNQESGLTSGNIKIASKYLESRELSSSFNFDVRDSRRMIVEITMDCPKRSNKLSGNLKLVKSGFEGEVKFISPLVAAGEMSASASYQNKKNKGTNGKVNLVLNGKSHGASFSFDNSDARQMIVNAEIRCPMVPSGLARFGGKYVQPRENTFEVELTSLIGEGLHTAKASYTMTRSSFVNVEVGLSVESPLLKSGVISFNANMALDTLKSLEGSMIFKGLGSTESRLAVNLRRDQWKSIEGFVTLNLPAGPMRMFRSDLKMKSDGTPKNVEFNLSIQTSIPEYQRFSASYKSKTSANVWDLSSSLQLPFEEMNNIALLATVHKNAEMTRVTPRVTLTLPNNKYIAFANFENEGNEMLVSVGSEIDDRKTEGTVEMKPNDIKLTLVTPVRGHERYSASGNFKEENNKKTLRLMLEGPKNKRVFIQGSGAYQNIQNFNGEFELKTPLSYLSDHNIRLRQQYRRGRMLTSLQHLSENVRTTHFQIEHHESNAGFNGNVELSTPLEALSSSKVTYTYAGSAKDLKINFLTEYNGRPVFQLDNLINNLNRKNEERTLSLSFPTVPYTLMASTKRGSVSEISIASIYLTQTLGFTSMYQASETSISHGAKFTWDEQNNGIASYEWRSSPKRNDGNEWYGRLNLPARSFEMRAEHEPTATGRTVSCDIFWDAARNPKKHMKLTVDHSDTSVYPRRYSHKMQATLSYPELNKDIVAKGEFTWTEKELTCRTELEYSRNAQQNIVFEIRGLDMSTRKQTQYQMSLAGRSVASRVNFNLVGEVTDNDQEMEGSVKMTFMGRDGREKLQELKGKIQKLKQKIEILARSNEERMNFNGQIFNRDQELTAKFDHTYNNEKVAYGDMRMSKRHKTMELNLVAFQEGVQVKTSMPGDLIHMEVSHTDANQHKTSDAMLHVALKENRLVQSRVNWRPEAINDASQRLSSTYSKANSRMKRMVIVANRDVSTEVNDAFRRVNDNVAPEMALLKNTLAMEFERISRDFGRVEETVKRMYARDDFYLRTMGEAAMDAGDSMIDASVNAFNTVSKACENMFNALNEVMSNLYDNFSEYTSALNRAYVRAKRQVNQTIERFEAMLDEMMQNAIVNMMEMSFDTMDTLAYYSDVLSSKASAAYEEFYRRHGPMINRVEELSNRAYENIQQRISEFLETSCTSKRCQNAREYVNNMIKYFNTLSYESIREDMNAYYKKVRANSAEIAVDVYSFIQDNSYFKNAAAQSFEQLRQTAYNLGIDTLAVNLMEEIYAKSMQAIWSSLRNAFEEFSEFRNNLHYTLEPESGRMELEMRLPSNKFTMADLMVIGENPDLQRLWEMRSQLITFDTNSLWDTYYQYKRYMDPLSWIPPFNARATLAGNQHFVTFDNFHFDYAGECSYLLARDFVDGNFSVSVNYVQDESLRAVRKSLVMVSDGMKVEISSDQKVSMNDVKVELPQELSPGGVTVTYEEGTIFVADTRRGFALRCNFEHDVCTLDLSGFYFGKTGGLFGTFNYEPSMDMTTHDNRMTRDVEEFAHSWQIGSGSCKTINRATKTSNDYRAQERCKSLFESNDSPLRACFRQAPADNFMKMCVNDLSQVRESERAFKTCTAVASYVDKCREQGVQMNMPKHCVRCERHDGQWMEGGDLVKITDSPSPSQASDVVFIVEQQLCNRNVPQMLAKVAQNLEEGLRKEGYRKVRFSVVGFGGEGVHRAPHIVTIDGKAFGSSRAIPTAFENLPITKNLEGSNVFMALRYAAGLPFLAGATKTFILAKCSSCRAQEMKADYSEMLRTMLDGDINLHLLMDLKMETRSAAKAEKAKRVLGLDSQFAYTQKDLKDNVLLGDRDLLAQLRIPKDICVPLALEVNGSVFSISKLLDTKKNMNKKTIEVLARRIMKTAVPSECQMCECLATPSGIGKSVCQRCVSPVVASMISDDLATPMMEFYKGNNNEDSGFEEENDLEYRSPAKPKVKSMRKVAKA